MGEKSIFGPGFDVFVDIFRYKIVFALIADYMVMEIQLPAKFNIPGTGISCHSGFHPSDHSRQQGVEMITAVKIVAVVGMSGRPQTTGIFRQGRGMPRPYN